ncbi:MAG TPA: TolC family protein [Bacteroidales bacterium]|nr:TolC family protein [Bacteroidales bacterium]
MKKRFVLKKQLIFFAALFAVFLHPTMAEVPEEPMIVSLEKAMELARELNPTLAIAEMEIERADAGVNIVRGRFLPNVSISGMYTRNIKTPVIFLPPGSPFGDVLEIGSDNSYMATLVAGMPVFNPALNASLRAAVAERALAGETLRASQIELEYFVHSAYYDVLLAKESARVMRQSLDKALETINLVENLTRQGLASEFELIRARVQAENLRPTLLQAENGYLMAANFLKALIGLEADREIVVTGTLAELSEKTFAGFNMLQAERGLQNNTELVRLDLQRNLLEIQARNVRATGLPSLALSSNYNFQTEANDFRFADYRWVNTFSAGLRFTIPLFSGFTIRNQARQLDLMGRQLELQRDYLEQNLSIQLGNLLNTMKVAREKSNTAQATVAMAERGFQIAQVRYTTGQGTLMEVNDSELALTQSRFNLIQAEHELLKSLAEYQRFIGEKRQ